VIQRLACSLVFLVVGCTGKGVARSSGPPAALAAPTSAAAAAENVGLLPVGELVGRVASFDGTHFAPAPNVTVTAVEAGVSAVTDVMGRYGFQRLAVGQQTLRVQVAQHETFTLVCRLSPVAGFARANLALIPMARPASQAADSVAIAGVLTDPRGAALPAGTVHAVDSISHDGKGGNEQVVADADGFFAYVMPQTARAALSGGQVALTGYGYTPGRVPVETTAILTLTVDSRPTQAVVLGTTAFLAIAAPAWAGGQDRLRAINADKVPLRRDELVLHFDQDGRTADAAPDEVATGRVTFTLPNTIDPGRGTLELRTLGLVPAPSISIGP
jgi:hypothetical protein